MNTNSCYMRSDVKSTVVRGLHLRETQKRDIIPTGVSRGGSMDKVATLSLHGGKNFYRWKEEANVTVREEAERSETV